MNPYTFLIVVSLSACALAQQPDNCSDQSGNYTLNGTFSTNLNKLLLSMSSNMSDNGFYYASLGQNSNQVYASALCKGDFQLDTCRSCVENAAIYLVKTCFPRKQGIVWYNIECTLRYSNWPFLGRQDNEPIHMSKTINTAASPYQFNKALRKLLDELLPEVASGGYLFKVAAEMRMTPDLITIMAFLQCSPDLSEQSCTNCLTACVQMIPDCCQNAIGVVVYRPSCNLRYEPYPFFNTNRIREVRSMLSAQPRAPLPQTLPLPTGNEANKKSQTTLFIVVSIILSLMLLVCIGNWLRYKTRKKKEETAAGDREDVSIEECLLYDFNKIREATNNFSDFNKLGEGGFGVVYKGELQDGQEIAVKRLFNNLGRGELEFQNEVKVLAKVNHRNLVRLFGFAQERTEKVLIYEFIRNGSLDHVMFGQTKSHTNDWNVRSKIIRGIARGLLYLHEDSRVRAIHRDLKPGNILLDEDMNPKIAEFGLARIYEHDESEVKTSRIAGT